MPWIIPRIIPTLTKGRSLTCLLPLAPITIVTGHYGVGKTNFALNLALAARAEGREVSVMDLDIVNPYFRSSDYSSMLEKRGIKTISPVFASSMLDAPSLPGSMLPAIGRASLDSPLIIDAGGDDEGAKALGRFASAIESRTPPYTMLYVINERRDMHSPEKAADMLRAIEAKSGLKATGIVNNTHLSEESTLEISVASLPFANEVSSILGIPLMCTTVPNGCGDDPRIPDAFGVDRHVRMPWE